MITGLKTLIFRMSLFLLYVFLFIVAMCKVNGRSSNFLASSNKRLSFKSELGVFIKSRQVHSGLQCTMLCQQLNYCKSVNFEKDGKLGEPRRCELLSVDKKERLNMLEDNLKFDYFEITDVCNDICLNGGSCIITSTSSFMCACQEGYKGVNCETDMNECTTNRHNCHQDAVCINTIGSFVCKCLPGYYGNGLDCIVYQRARGFENSSILANYGNISYIQALNTYLTPHLTSTNTSRWIVCWKALEDGWYVEKTFHPQCDGKGPSVTIVRVGRYVFGGYTDISWGMNDGYHFSNRSFLYSLYNINGFQPIKLNLTGKHNINAVSSGIGFQGPSFGGGYDLFLSNQASKYNTSYTKPHTYQPPLGCTLHKLCPFFAGSAYFIPSDIEVFYEST